MAQVNKYAYIARLQSIISCLKPRSIKTFLLLFALGFSLNLILSACAESSLAKYVAVPQFGIGLDKEKVVRLGHQKFGTLSIVKARGDLEKRLEPLGIKVLWSQFPAGPQLLEALNAGRLDFGHTGETPPISAQAAGAPLLYVASEPPNPQGEAILVQKDSPIRSVAELKGKKVALNKGSNVHYLVVRTLEEAGLKYSDIKPVFLPPADARAAFEQKVVAYQQKLADTFQQLKLIPKRIDIKQVANVEESKQLAQNLKP